MNKVCRSFGFVFQDPRQLGRLMNQDVATNNYGEELASVPDLLAEKYGLIININRFLTTFESSEKEDRKP